MYILKILTVKVQILNFIKFRKLNCSIDTVLTPMKIWKSSHFRRFSSKFIFLSRWFSRFPTLTMLITIRLMKLNWETLTIANKHHNIQLFSRSSKTTKDEKVFSNNFFSSHLALKSCLMLWKITLQCRRVGRRERKSFSFISF